MNCGTHVTVRTTARLVTLIELIFAHLPRVGRDIMTDFAHLPLEGRELKFTNLRTPAW